MKFHDGLTCTNNVDWFQVFDRLLGLRTRPHKFTWDETHHKTVLYQRVPQGSNKDLALEM
jgi:hypothetical protein